MVDNDSPEDKIVEDDSSSDPQISNSGDPADQHSSSNSDGGTEKKDISPQNDDDNGKKDITNSEDDDDGNDSDPLEDIFSEQKKDLSGEAHLSHAIDKKHEELSSLFENADKDFLTKFKELKPKIQDGVAQKLGEECTFGGKEFSTAKELLDLLGTKNTDNAPKDTSKSEQSSILKGLKLDFRDMAKEHGFDFADDLQAKDGEQHHIYKKVSEDAKTLFQTMKTKGIPLENFEDLFDFEAKFLKAMNGKIKESEYKKGQKHKEKIANATKAQPDKDSLHSDKTDANPYKEGTLLSQEEYYALDEEGRDSYFAKNKDGNGNAVFS